MNGVVNMVKSFLLDLLGQVLNRSIQFGSLITYGLGHIQSSIFKSYQVGLVQHLTSERLM